MSELEALGFDAMFNSIVKDYFEAEYPLDSLKKQLVIGVSDFEYYYNEQTCDICGGTLNSENECTKINQFGAPACDNYGKVVYEYRSAYKLVTGSAADADDYRYTKYTNDSGNVVIVTYERTVNGVTDTVRFILNYNTFGVNVRLDGEVYPVDKYGYYKIND